MTAKTGTPLIEFPQILYPNIQNSFPKVQKYERIKDEIIKRHKTKVQKEKEDKNEEIETILMPIVQNENAGEDRKEDEEEMSIEDHLITTATGMRFQVSGLCLITLLLFHSSTLSLLLSLIISSASFISSEYFSITAAVSSLRD